MSDGILYHTVNATEDVLRWLRVEKIAWWPFYALAMCRRRLSEGKTRRLLCKAVRSWADGGIYSQDYFYGCADLKSDIGNRIIMVTIEYRERFD